MSAAAALRATEPLPLPSGLSLSPRLKLLLTFFRADLTVRPLDEWQLKSALLAFLRDPPLSLPLLPDSDLSVRRLPDLQKRRREEPVASGILHVRDLSFLRPRKGDSEAEGMTVEQEDEKYFEWRSSLVEKLEGIELNLEGVKFRMAVEIPPSDDFRVMKKSWEDFYSSELLNSRNPVRKIAKRPDTIVVRGVPSRWFAEIRVSSKPSTLVTHTIFSALGKIRTLNIANDDDELEAKEDGSTKELISGLNCKVWVQFESYDDFHDAMKALCGRSLEKEGSWLKVDYDVTWDHEGFFRIAQYEPAHSRLGERDASASVHGRKKHYTSRIESDHRKRFRD
ncbi:A-kinase anchor protein 17A isoform X1 [Panicum miliaceum]|uniref:A-kinase anchor protein 17A isoform X1 n=1 Tax=Panicum miliaceum TaxID=4540 RepID=A0A3L6QUS4_PANMI|nr:A-kinase anchor protein 17A isoform X1 [Panicum miliaceum]